MRHLTTIFVFCAACDVSAFSLLGPIEKWQTPAIGYNVGGNEIGAAKELGFEYRWNVPVITYGFDMAFMDFFGAAGVAAVDEAFAILNYNPPASQMDVTGGYLPDSRRVNWRALTASLFDLRTAALSATVTALGLGPAERSVWALRQRQSFPNVTNYLVISRNYDPETLEPTAFVNGTRYTYQVVEDYAKIGAADVVEIPVDQSHAHSSIAGLLDGGLYLGLFVSGLTQDDAGGIRYLLSPANVNLEPTPHNVHPLDTASAALTETAARPGVNKLTFIKADRFWQTTPEWSSVTEYTDRYYSGNELVERHVRRVTSRPDIVFSVDSNLVFGSSYPSVNSPAVTSTSLQFRKAVELEGHPGPGIIEPGVTIRFARFTGAFANYFPGYISEGDSFALDVRWASFDQTTNEPVRFPVRSVLLAGRLEARLLAANETESLEGTFIGAPFESYALQQSSNLLTWTGTTVLSNRTGVHSLSMPVTNGARFFRTVRLR